MYWLVLCILLINKVFARDETTVKFLKSFIENERKPTHLSYSGLCWGKYSEVVLANEMSKLGVKISTSLEQELDYQEHAKLFLTNLDCHQAKQVLRNAASKDLFRFGYRWLVLSTNADQHINAVLSNISILAASDLVLAERKGDHFAMTELHKASPDGPTLSFARGYYNGTLFDVRPHRELFRRRKDVMGHPLTMANVIQESNNTEYHLPREDRLDLQNDALAKACWVCAKIAFNMLNATPRYIYSYRFGYKVNGSWSGMIDDINNRKADLGTNCVLFIDRLEVITYTDMVVPMRMRFIFRQPPLAYASNIFSLSFTRNVWLSIAICTAVSTVTLYLASKWEVTVEKGTTQLDGSIGDALLLTMSAVTQQGCYLEPKRTPGRIMGWVVFTALMALYAAYSANIVVLLQAPSHSITSLAQLAASKITLAANDVDYNRFVLNGNDPLRQSIHNRIIPDGGKPQYFDKFEGVERIRQGLFAFHSVVEPVYRRVQETFLESEKCDLTEVDFIGSSDAFTPVRKDSPYLELLRVVYKQIRESGVRSALNRRYQVPKPRCGNRMTAFSSVGLLDMRPVLLLMLYGIFVSLTILQVEILLFKLNKWRLSKIKDNTKIFIK